jgi:oxygen-dependent protoporphyrinogen oxidase
LSEPFRRSQPPESDESIAEFVRRKFGDELLENLVGPLVSGVYAGDPQKLSLRSAFPLAYQWEKDYGSVLRGAMKSRPAGGKPRPSLCSFRDSVATLIRTLGETLGAEIHCGASVESMRRLPVNGKSQFELHVWGQAAAQTLTADAIVVATPARATAKILQQASAAFGEHLGKIEYAPVAVVATGYRKDQLARPINGFGFLVARAERRRVLGTVWNSSLFPGRAPEGTLLLTSFVGGATDPEICQWGEERIANTVTQELVEILGISGPPVLRVVYRHSQALPQYNLGHAQTIEAVRALCHNVPGLFLTGNYLEGVSIGSCVEQALRTAESVRKYLGTAEGAELENRLPRHAVLDRQ